MLPRTEDGSYEQSYVNYSKLRTFATHKIPLVAQWNTVVAIFPSTALFANSNYQIDNNPQVLLHGLNGVLKGFPHSVFILSYVNHGMFAFETALLTSIFLYRYHPWRILSPFLQNIYDSSQTNFMNPPHVQIPYTSACPGNGQIAIIDYIYLN